MRPTYRATPRAAIALLAALALATFALGSCAGSPSEASLTDGALPLGTWGADGAGVIVSESQVHVHIGCTSGDFPRPSPFEPTSFNVAGRYHLRIHPVVQGPYLPARFSGVVNGSTLTLAVAVDDTVEKRLVILGPVTVRLGQEPRLGPCPICQPPTGTRQAEPRPASRVSRGFARIAAVRASARPPAPGRAASRSASPGRW